MDLLNNEKYTCKVVRINDKKVDLVASLSIDEENITKVQIFNVEKDFYKRIKDLKSINIVFQYKGYITLFDCRLIETIYQGGPNPNEIEINLTYESTLLLKNLFLKSKNKIGFDGIVCSVTQITELLGFCPYRIDYDKSTYPSIDCKINGNIISKDLGNGFSFFVAPSIKRESGEIGISMYGL